MEIKVIERERRNGITLVTTECPQWYRTFFMERVSAYRWGAKDMSDGKVKGEGKTQNEAAIAAHKALNEAEA